MNIGMKLENDGSERTDGATYSEFIIRICIGTTELLRRDARRRTIRLKMQNLLLFAAHRQT